MSKQVRALRGATALAADTPEEMDECLPELVTAMLESNDLDYDDIISVLFTATADLVSKFPAASARQLDLADTPLINARELEVEGGMPRTVRVLMHAYSERSKREITHVYLRGTEVLRPDLGP